jgi:hypothetical protein
MPFNLRALIAKKFSIFVTRNPGYVRDADEFFSSQCEEIQRVFRILVDTKSAVPQNIGVFTLWGGFL